MRFGILENHHLAYLKNHPKGGEIAPTVGVDFQ